MQSTPPSDARRAALPTILVAAVIQGWSLYGLHHAIKSHVWPATQPRWLLGFFAVAVLVPITVQLLADHARTAATWLLVAAMGIVLFYFGWHHGSGVADDPTRRFANSGEYFPLAFVLVVLWLHVLPFVQSRLAAGKWSAEYRALFANAWRNTIALAEAALFTALFWLLLFLWQSLFHMLRIDFFRELFEEPIFVYPVTAIVFGCALHLIGSIDRLVSAVLEQILNLFKWLAIVAGALLALFTIALVLRLPSLMFTGQRAIGASWLLWLIAVVVLLLNAAYRDGTVERPYPGWIARSLRFIVPLLLVISLTAIYALLVRAHHYGLTVERVWAFVVAGAALIYALGYSVAAFGRGAWLAGVARVNVFAAIALIVAISAALTPLLSPYRLAANSQYRLVLENRYKTASENERRATPFHYLRFDSGRYGRERLEQLTQLQDHPGAERIRELAAEATRQTSPWAQATRADAEELLARLAVFPAGRAIDADLRTTVIADLRMPENAFPSPAIYGSDVAGLYVDLNGDGVDQFVLLTVAGGYVYQNHDGQWHRVGRVYVTGPISSWQALLSGLTKGDVSARNPQWKELWIGSRRFRVDSLQ